MPDTDTRNKNEPFVGKRIRDWTAFATGLIGTAIAISAHLQSRHNAEQLQRNAERTQKVELDQLLAEAWDLMGAEQGIVSGTIRRKRAERNDLQLANRNIDQALTLDPSSAKAHFYKGVYLDLSGKDAQAQDELKKAIDLDSSYAQAYTALGSIYLQRSNFEEAELAYRKAIELQPDIHAPYNNLAISILKRSGSEDEAIELLRKSIKLEPFLPGHYRLLAIGYRRKGNPDKALEYCEQALALNPNYALAYNIRGHALVDQEKYEEAIVAYRKAIEIDPQYATAWKNLAKALRLSGDVTGAEEAAAKADKLSLLRPDEFDP